MIKNTKYWKDLTQEEAENLIYEPEARLVRLDLKNHYETGFRGLVNCMLTQYFEAFINGDIATMNHIKNKINRELDFNSYLLDGSWADEYGKEFIVTTEVSVNQIGKEV